MAEEKKLNKSLKLFDVYSISTGAMFSSGFFLLPGIAASMTGASVYMAYFAAAILILPAMFSIAELSTAMPKAGGTYYFIDRALGPLMGSVGGLGSWVAIVFKSAFALVGMGAYLSLYIDLPMTVTAVILTLLFGLLNIFGAKETTMLQRILVTTLVIIMAAFVIQGLAVVGIPDAFFPRGSYDGFFKNGFTGFAATVGLVFVSYAGLTKVASVAEEVQRPDRNLPLGMVLSLITATTVYVLGTMVMINVLPAEELYGSLTPVADAGRKFLDWVPYDMGVILIVVAAIAAFASTGNAGIMSASRYPYAMAKDKLVPEWLAKIGRFGTPTISIMVTVGIMILILIFMDVQSVAKLASAFQLMLFGIINLAVIVMRESRIETYRPGFKSPLYPWLQIAGVGIAFWLIAEMGGMALGFTGTIIIACIIWYYFYAAGKTIRSGAINHVHARLGSQRYEGLERELMTIIHDRTMAENLSYEALIARTEIIDYDSGHHQPETVIPEAARSLADQSNLEMTPFREAFNGEGISYHRISHKVMICYKTIADLEQPELVVFRFHGNARVEFPSTGTVHTLLFLAVPITPAGLDLRLAGHLAEVVQSDQFEERWMAAREPRELREILMRDDHFLHLPVSAIPALQEKVGMILDDIDLPGSCLIALIERDGKVVVASPKETLKTGDYLAIIGEPEDLARLTQ